MTCLEDWPVVVDPYDSVLAYRHFLDLSPGIEGNAQCPWTDSEVADEKYCFMNADGVIARHGYVPMLLKETGIKTPILLLEDCCNRLFFQEVPEVSGPKQEEWSVVYPGIIYPMSCNPDFFSDKQLVPLGKLFAQERIHFHIYPSPHHDYPFPAYKAEARRNYYFHIHEPVPFHQVHKVISRYDFGWDGIDVSKSVIFSNSVIAKNSSNMRTVTFLEAGLPIVSEGTLGCSDKIIKEFSAGISLEGAPDGLRNAIESRDIRELRTNVLRAREVLELKYKSNELMKFLQKLKKK